MVTIVPPSPGEPRRPQGPRDPGDAWVVADDGTRYWGRFGAAGLLAYDPARGILLQQRVEWSHHGGTWGIPGGALHEGESPVDGAIREATEEAGIPTGALSPASFMSVHDVGIWSYVTVGAHVAHPFEPTITDAESVALEWVPLSEVDQRALHPGFAEAWPRLREALDLKIEVIVGGGYAQKLSRGIRGDAVGAPVTTLYPSVIAADSPASVLAQVEASRAYTGTQVHVVTDHHDIYDALTALGAIVHDTVWISEVAR